MVQLLTRRKMVGLNPLLTFRCNVGKSRFCLPPESSAYEKALDALLLLQALFHSHYRYPRISIRNACFRKGTLNVCSQALDEAFSLHHASCCFRTAFVSLYETINISGYVSLVQCTYALKVCWFRDILSNSCVLRLSALCSNSTRGHRGTGIVTGSRIGKLLLVCVW